ncbi:hypothetical protein M405DRAFT_733938 [Rhizopogon salebrosus TDB-379]|nr:hypothetical protein M405DRAFT_733938 [Rhizopogon salebrosus TDB-379]
MLCGVLAELGWGGWKLVGLPSLLSATRTLLESQPSLTLRLLVSSRVSTKYRKAGRGRYRLETQCR